MGRKKKRSKPDLQANRSRVAARIETVFELLIAGASRSDVLQFAAKEASPPWRLKPRAIDYYIAQANRKFEALAEANLREHFGRALARREKLYVRSMKVQDFKTALQVDKDRCELLGLYPDRERALPPAPRFGSDGERIDEADFIVKPVDPREVAALAAELERFFQPPALTAPEGSQGAAAPTHP